jgi:hypothetical protein
VLPNGRYSVMRTGEIRSVAVKRVVKGALRGKVILLLRTDNDRWSSFAFLGNDNSVKFFKRFEAQNSGYLDKIPSLVAAIARNSEQARALYDSTGGRLRAPL